MIGPGLNVLNLFAGLLASQGITNVDVRSKPRIAVISTGNELVTSGTDLSSGQVGNLHPDSRPQTKLFP